MKNLPVKMLGVKASKRGLVDDDIFELIKDSKWFETRQGYVTRNVRKDEGKRGQSLERLHRYVMQGKPGQLVDHINGNKLDNRRVNLRFTDHRGNMMNISKANKKSSSGLRGVHWATKYNKWNAQIFYDGKAHFLGYFCDKEKAHEAYKTASIAHFGDLSPFKQ